jgi:Predicted transcriptional regulator
MPISYDKLFALLSERGFSSYRIRRDKIIGESLLQKLREGGDIDTRTIKRLCALLQCQPGDIMEYIPDDRLTD